MAFFFCNRVLVKWLPGGWKGGLERVGEGLVRGWGRVGEGLGKGWGRVGVGVGEG